MQSGKILVAGATGRVGGAAVERLLEAGFEVRALVRRLEKGVRLRSLGAGLAVGDATPPDTLGPSAGWPPTTASRTRPSSGASS